jgi:hypothetical protein
VVTRAMTERSRRWIARSLGCRERAADHRLLAQGSYAGAKLRAARTGQNAARPATGKASAPKAGYAGAKPSREAPKTAASKQWRRVMRRGHPLRKPVPMQTRAPIRAAIPASGASVHAAGGATGAAGTRPAQQPNRSGIGRSSGGADQPPARVARTACLVALPIRARSRKG